MIIFPRLRNVTVCVAVLFVSWTCCYSKENHGKRDRDRPLPDEPKETRQPTPCEVCRVLVHEMEEKMKKTAAKLKLDLGSREGPDSRKLDYSRSELRLIEILDTACDDVGHYSVHVKEGMQRFAKQESETLDALNSLRRKGVKVEIGMPWEIVDKQPNKEIMALKRKCEETVEKYEDDLSAWYFQQQDTKPLTDFICKEKLLKNENQTCLSEVWKPYGDRPDTTDEEKEKEREEGRQKIKKWKQEELEGKDKEWQEIKNRRTEKMEL